MTDYTPNHSLPIIDPSVDKIAAPGQNNLAADINELSQATEQGLDGVEGRGATALAAEAARTDRIVLTSHLGLDTDGTPAFIEGSITHRIAADTDGNPYYVTA